MLQILDSFLWFLILFPITTAVYRGSKSVLEMTQSFIKKTPEILR